MGASQPVSPDDVRNMVTIGPAKLERALYDVNQVLIANAERFYGGQSVDIVVPKVSFGECHKVMEKYRSVGWEVIHIERHRLFRGPVQVLWFYPKRLRKYIDDDGDEWFCYD